jgi:pimeloyl-[acyl-carrier protein] methyl ester esterase
MTLGIDRYGDGPDLALIHGWGIGASAWDELLPLLTPHFRVHRVTLPGYPHTTDGSAAQRIERSFQPPHRQDPRQSTILEAPAGKTPLDALSSASPASCSDSAAPADFIATAAAIAAALPPGCALCGWSLGALLALQAVKLAPQRVARLILCGATPSFIERDGWPSAQPPTLLDRFDQALADDAAATLKRFIALFNQGDRQARAITRTLTRALAADGLADGETLARGLDWLRRVDLRATIKTIDQPTLVIHGEADPLMPLAAAHWLADALPQARREVFAGAAHAPFVSDRERFAQLLIDFCHAPASR